MRDIELTLKSARLVSAFLADPACPRYGFDLMRLTGLPSGSVYPMLARFEAAGWLELTREDIDPSIEKRPARMLYALTAEAVPAARAKLAVISEELSAWRIKE
jgi:PadR family transcriptional regulator, regulatory protein PadR